MSQTSNAFRVRPASAHEAEAVAAFVLPTMAKLYPPGAYNPNPVDLRRFEETYVVPNDAALFIAADADDRIIGTAAVRPYDRRFPFMNEQLGSASACEMTKVYIDERCRRQGVGTALYRLAEHYARQAGYAISYLHTSVHLPGGLPFWLSRGYEPRYEETGKIVHMAKPLDGDK